MVRLAQGLPRLSFTGERFVPSFRDGSTELEHLHRYYFASQLAKCRRVIDIACGEGYGSDILAQEAISVIGVELDKNSIISAKDRYKRGNLEFLEGNILEVPVSDACFDLAVCFETIEHIADHNKAIKELKRVLVKDGIILVSTPNKTNGRKDAGGSNPFHVLELKSSELENLLRGHFKNVHLYRQEIVFGSLLIPEKRHPGWSQDLSFVKMEALTGEISSRPADDMVCEYVVAIASDVDLPILGVSLYAHDYPLKPMSSLIGGIVERDEIIARFKENSQKEDAVKKVSDKVLSATVYNKTEEYDETFHSFHDWQSWSQLHQNVFDPQYYNGIAERVLSRGFLEPLTGRCPARVSIKSFDTNWREGLVLDGINSRMRAVMRVIERTFSSDEYPGLRIYAPEAITAFALRMRGIFPRFIGSEYTEVPELRSALYPILFEDLTALSLPDEMFNLVTTNEVLEHVPDLDSALLEMCRILKSGGWHIGTHPFLFSMEKSQRRARIQDGEIVHLLEPEYHGNPMGITGSLVYETPAWDILERCRRAGFSFSAMRFIVSESSGCLSDDCSGIFVLTCQK
jgi:ubiquinone/menaquinone biosynthesis C-methylase UbiE